jgi:hypothetical protein
VRAAKLLHHRLIVGVSPFRSALLARLRLELERELRLVANESRSRPSPPDAEEKP